MEPRHTVNVCLGVIAANLLDTSSQPGTILSQKCNGMWNYNIVMKKRVEDKPRYEYLRLGLSSLANHMKENGVSNMTFPLTPDTCVIAELKWNAARTIIKNIFYNESVSITSTDENKLYYSNVSSTPFLDIYENKL